MSAAALGLWLEAHLSRHARHARSIQDKQHVDAWDRLGWQLRRSHAQLPLARGTLLVERELHVAVAGRQAVRIVVAAQERHRGNLRGITRDRDVEVPAVRDLLGRLRDDRARRSTAVLLE